MSFLTHHPYNEEFSALTKGDNNGADDWSLYPSNLFWLKWEHIIGRIRGYLPYVGYISIIINDYPILKFLLLASMIVSVMINKDKNKSI